MGCHARIAKAGSPFPKLRAEAGLAPDLKGRCFTNTCWANEGLLDSQEPSPIPATPSDHVGYSREPFLIVRRWTVSSWNGKEEAPPGYPLTWYEGSRHHSHLRGVTLRFIEVTSLIQALLSMTNQDASLNQRVSRAAGRWRLRSRLPSLTAFRSPGPADHQHG